jgi:hypothetical protein
VLVKHVGEQDLTGTTANMFAAAQGAAIGNLTLKGNGFGSIGLRYQDCRDVSPYRVNAYGFSDAGFELKGAIGNSLSYCRAIGNAIGVRYLSSDDSAVLGGEDLPANLNHLIACVIIRNTTLGISFTGGAMLSGWANNVESNGTDGDSATGGILIAPTHLTPGPQGLIWHAAWGEGNYGASRSNSLPSRTIISHHLSALNFHAPSGARPAHTIVVDGSGAGINTVKFDQVLGEDAAGGTPDIFRTGGDNLRLYRDPITNLAVTGSGGNSYLESVTESTFTGPDDIAGLYVWLRDDALGLEQQRPRQHLDRCRRERR